MTRSIGNKKVPIIKPLFDKETGSKIASEQKLKDGVYPEHLVYLKSVGLCGQVDVVEVVNGEATPEEATSTAIDALAQ